MSQVSSIDWFVCSVGSVAEWCKAPVQGSYFDAVGSNFVAATACRQNIKSIVNVFLQRLLNWLFVMPRLCLSRRDSEPSGLRQWFQVPRNSMVWFRIPPLPRVCVRNNY